jgi:hypothetical protein
MYVKGSSMPQTIRTTIPVLLLALALGSSTALAEDSSEDGVRLREGLWVFDVRILMPMQTEPSVQKFKTCVESDPITASTLMPWAESQGCKIRSTKAVGDKLTWKLRCKKDGQKSRGSGEFEVDGDSAEGKARVNFEMAGQRMSVVTEWDANRVGGCSASTASDSASPEEPEAE